MFGLERLGGSQDALVRGYPVENRVESKAESLPGIPFNSRKNVTVKVVDMYGFCLDLSVEASLVFNLVKERVAEQGRVWWAMEANKGAGWYLQPEISANSDQGNIVSSLSISNLTRSVQLKKLIWKGIPPSLRPRVWQALSGAAKKRSTVPDSYYQDLIEAVAGRQTPATHQIDRDLSRTFPAHPWVNSEEGRATLRRVLVAYSFRDSHIGYCQGMNYVAALLLLVMKTEEQAFWMLAVLLENVLFSDCYSENLTGCHVQQRVFNEVFVKKCPRLAAHFDQIGFDISLITTEWFLCLFAKSFPSETTLRVWDVVFNEGVKFLFRVALAIFKLKEDELMVTNHIGESIKVLQNATHQMYDPDVLFKAASEKVGSLWMLSIPKQSKKQQSAVVADLEQRFRRWNVAENSSPSSPVVS